MSVHGFKSQFLIGIVNKLYKYAKKAPLFASQFLIGMVNIFNGQEVEWGVELSSQFLIGMVNPALLQLK